MVKDKEVKIEEDVKEEVVVAKKAPVATDARSPRWNKFVEAYKVSNPVKYASKKANGEFDKIPDSFA